MRNARGFVDDYRRKGYPDDRIRIIASMRPEPLRSEALQILDAEAQASKEANAPPAGHEEAALTRSEQPAAQADEVTAVFEPSDTPSAAVEPAARGMRDTIAADLQKTSAELARARADLARLSSDNAELPTLRERVGELEAALAARESLLADKDRALSENEASLADERVEREAAASRMEKLTATIAEQSARMQELEALHQQLTGTDAELDELRAAAAQLKQGVEAKCDHIADLEADVTKAREEAAALRLQVESNEKSVGQLQDKLTSREAELASLRAHFDREAADLKKRADQEIWIVRRRLRRFQRGALLSGAVAACFLGVLAYYAIGGSHEESFLPKQLSAAASHARETGALVNPPETPPRPLGSANNVASLPAPVKQVDVPRTVSWNVPKVDEPPRGNAAPPPTAKTPTAPALAIPAPAAAAPKPAAASKVVTYTVKKGETLWMISKKVLGRGEAWRDIARENKISVAQAGHLTEGMTLTITVPASN
jgi:LysM repeat protein/predicted  nucleic acid-binding Zn-ribbon protein